MDHVQPVLEPRATVRDLREVVATHRLLAVPQKRAVIGGDDAERVRPDRVPEDVLVFLRPRRRRVHPLRALEARPLEIRVVDEEVLGTCLAVDVPAFLPRELDRLDRLFAGHMDDVER